MNTLPRIRPIVLALLSSALLAACGSSSDGITEASALSVSVGGPTAQPGGAVSAPPSGGAKTTLDAPTQAPEAPTTLPAPETTGGVPLRAG